MNRKMKKIISMLLIMMLVIFMVHISYAITGEDLVGSFNGNTQEGKDGVTILQKVIGPVLNVVRIVATGISIFMVTFLGIKYMIAAPTEKAELKKNLITFTIGAVVVVMAVNLLGIINGAVSNIFG